MKIKLRLRQLIEISWKQKHVQDEGRWKQTHVAITSCECGDQTVALPTTRFLHKFTPRCSQTLFLIISSFKSFLFYEHWITASCVVIAVAAVAAWVFQSPKHFKTRDKIKKIFCAKISWLEKFLCKYLKCFANLFNQHIPAFLLFTLLKSVSFPVEHTMKWPNKLIITGV